MSTFVGNDPMVRATARTEIPDLAALGRRGIVPIGTGAIRPRAPRSRRSSSRPTWADLVAREPRLGELLAAIEALPHGDRHWCGVKAWFGQPRKDDGLKARMVRLVGWHAEQADQVLRTDVAYRTAYPVLYGALPPCGDCVCGSLARVLYGAGVPR